MNRLRQSRWVLFLLPWLLVLAAGSARGQDTTYLLALQTLQREDWDRAESYFRALIQNMSGKEGSRRIPYYESQKYRQYYPHLGLGYALYRRALLPPPAPPLPSAPTAARLNDPAAVID